MEKAEVDSVIEKRKGDVREPEMPLFVVGIGASAGGLEALQTFFRAIPSRIPDVAFVLVQHLAPQYNSMMVELLSRVTDIPIVLVTEDKELRPGTIYQIAPGSQIEVARGWVRFERVQRRELGDPNTAVNVMLTSLAQSYGTLSAGVILSGTGSDGRAGVVRIKEKGGVVFVQDPQTAKFDGMPVEAIGTGLIDFIASPDKIAAEVIRVSGKIIQQRDFPSLSKDDIVSEMLRLLRELFHVNFEEYKMSTVRRRIQNRMNVVGFDTVEEYYQELCSNTTEAAALYNNILIGVTGFLRDKDHWQAIYEDVLPVIVADAVKEGRAIRIWSAGCSSGEESYSIAILLHEYLDATGIDIDFKVYATDIDDVGVVNAGQGFFPEVVLKDDLKRKYFFPVKDGLQICRPLRSHLLVTKHNMATDPPFKDMDLIICRNVLIYFETALKKRVLSGFHFGLRNGGFLFLGSSETIDTGSEDKFSTVNSKARIFCKNMTSKSEDVFTGRGFECDRRSIQALTQTKAMPSLQNRRPPGDGLGNLRFSSSSSVANDLAEMLCVKFNLPCALIDSTKEVLHTYGDFRELIVPSGNISLRVSSLFRRELSVPIGIAVPKALEMERTVVYKNILLSDSEEEDFVMNAETPTGEGADTNGPNKSRYIDIVIAPLHSKTANSEHMIAVIFLRSNSWGLGQMNGGFHTLSGSVPELQELGRSQLSTDAKERILELERALDATQRSLRDAVVQLETANEELQSTNEELVASNEELQSTNEELQSVNEELYTVNSEHAIRIEELQEINNDMSNLVNATGIPTIFLDTHFHVRKFTRMMSKVMTIRAGDIGRPFEEILFHKPGITMGLVKAELERCLASGVISRHLLHVDWCKASFLMTIRRCDSSFVEDPTCNNELVPSSRHPIGSIPYKHSLTMSNFGIVITFTDVASPDHHEDLKINLEAHQMLNTMDRAMISISNKDGKVMYANKVAAVDLFGYDSVKGILGVYTSSLYEKGASDNNSPQQPVRVFRRADDAKLLRIVEIPSGDSTMVLFME